MISGTVTITKKISFTRKMNDHLTVFALISKLECHSQVVFFVSLRSLSLFSALLLSSRSSFARSMPRPLSLSGSRRVFSRGRSRSRSLSRSILRSLSRSLRSSRYRSRGFSSRVFLVSRSGSRFFSLLFGSLLLSFSARNETEKPQV